MKRRSGGDDEVERLFTYPPYWMVYALPWPSANLDVSMAEAAYVIAPKCIGRKGLPRDVECILEFTDFYAHRHPKQRVVWFSDVSRLLSDKGDSWDDFGVDWERALLGIPELPILGLYMTISRRAYFHLENAAMNYTIYYEDGTRESLTAEEREEVRQAFERQLAADWPAFIRQKLANGTLTIG